MAKEDFCFTYYDGDAARDKAHMNRLERGAYDDIISAQRKRGHLSESDMKKVLGKDYDECWGAMEWVLMKDEEGKYFIEWVDKSIVKSREHSIKQKEKIDTYWKKKKESEDILRNNHGINLEEPLEDGNGDGDGNGVRKENKGGTGGKEILPQMQKVWMDAKPNYPSDKTKDIPALLNIARFLAEKEGLLFNLGNNETIERILVLWTAICQHVAKDSFFKKFSISQVDRNIQPVIISIQDGATNGTNGSKSRTITGDDLNKAHAKYSIVE